MRPADRVLLTSTARRNDHNGFSQQGPGLIQNVITARGNIGRVYLPPDSNCPMSVADHRRRSRSYVNLVVVEEQPQLHIRIVHAATGELLRELTIDPRRGYQPRGLPPGPAPETKDARTHSP